MILDSSSDTSPSAPSLSTNTESQNTTTTQPCNVTPVTPSKRPRSHITDTSSMPASTTTSRPPILKSLLPLVLNHHQLIIFWYIYQNQNLLNAT